MNRNEDFNQLEQKPVSEWTEDELQCYVEANRLENMRPEGMTGIQRSVVLAWGERAATRRTNAEALARETQAANVYDAVEKEKRRQAVAMHLSTKAQHAQHAFRTGKADADVDDVSITVTHGGVSMRITMAEINATFRNPILKVNEFNNLVGLVLKMRNDTSNMRMHRVCNEGATKYDFQSQIVASRFLAQVSPEFAEEVL